MTDEPQPTVRLSVGSASLLVAVTGAAGALNTALAAFLLKDPFGAGVGPIADDLLRVRHGGIVALAAAAEASSSAEVLDLDPVAEAALGTVDNALWLALRALEGIRRLDLGPSAEAEVERFRDTLEALAELAPGAARRGPAPTSGETAERC